MNVKLFLCLNGNNVAYVWLVSFSQFYLLVGGRGSFAADLSGEAQKRTEGTEKGLMIDTYYISGGNVN